MNKQWRNLKEQTATEHDYLKEIENFKRVVKEITEERDKIKEENEHIKRRIIFLTSFTNSMYGKFGGSK